MRFLPWAEDAKKFHPNWLEGPIGGLYADAYAFSPPVSPINTPAEPCTLELRIGDAIRRTNFSSIAACLVGRYLTNGPVIITGCDLFGADRGGNSYDFRQADHWQHCCRVMERTYAHELQGGPIREMLPIWLNERPEAQTTWLALGGGPSARQHLKNVLLYEPRVITSNAGLKLIGNPDAYLCTDPNALITYRQGYEHASKHGVEVIHRGHGIDYSPHDLVYHGRSSGVLSVRAAIARGATQVHIVGYDGWSPSEMSYTVHGSTYSRKGMNEAIAAALDNVMWDHPEVSFIWHGASLIHRFMTEHRNLVLN